jgi:mono/diheme cytochrome c family protein
MPALRAVAALSSLALVALVRGVDLNRRHLGAALGCQQSCHGCHGSRAGKQSGEQTGRQRAARTGSA